MNQSDSAIAVNLNTEIYPDDLTLFNRFATLYCDINEFTNTITDVSDTGNLDKTKYDNDKHARNSVRKRHYDEHYSSICDKTHDICDDKWTGTTDNIKELVPF